MATVSGVSTATTQTNAAGTTTGLAANFETFMALLTAQLKAQDPLSPLDTKDFTNQLVQFTGVEQQLKTNQLLTSLTTSLSQNSGAIAVSYLGKEATANTDISALQNGAASWDYNLPQTAASVKIQIFDANNKLVNTYSGDNSAGDKKFTWDGKTSAGDTRTSGEYRLVITAANAAGTAITAPISKTGIIDYVDMSGTEASVRIGGTKVALSSISKVGMPAT